MSFIAGMEGVDRETESAGGHAGETPSPGRTLALSLVVRDAEVIAELARRPAGRERDEYALAALRLGVLALRSAGGVIDSAAIREEGIRIVGQLREALTDHSQTLVGRLNTVVQTYFDPATGHLQQRLERLVRNDGELEALLKRHISADDSTIARTLAQHVGEQSPVFRLLSPTQTDGVIASLEKVIAEALRGQRDQILGQFSLDAPESALSRLKSELTTANGMLRADFSTDIEKVRREFSLDNAEGALSRLVRGVEDAQKRIVSEFSLDNEASAMHRLQQKLSQTHDEIGKRLTLDDAASPLSLLKQELLNLIQSLSQQNTTFQTEVRETLAALVARRQEAARSTIHGFDFEAAVGERLQVEAQRLGDVLRHVGNETGKQQRSKIGDYTLTIGPDAAAAGAVIVVECKETQGFTLANARQEIEAARQNRGAGVGLFVFSARSAPAGLEPLQRIGDDVFAIWNEQDVTSDVVLRAAVSVARALATRQAAQSAEATADVQSLERAIQSIQRDLQGIERIETYANTGKSAIEKIQTEAVKVREDLGRQIDHLTELARALSGRS